MSFSFVYVSKFYQTFFQRWFITQRSNIAFTNCHAIPTCKIPRLKVKPLQINDSNQGLFLQLSCLAGSNLSLVSTLNFVKLRKVTMGLSCIIGANHGNLKNIYIKHFLVHFGVHQNVFPLKFRVTLTLTSSSNLDSFDANIWSFFHRLNFLATFTVWRRCC